jgi:glycosyltransferase involved in cell wall biosynthesis
MPLSLIQAGMAGKPVVSTNVGAVSEVIVEGETGYISGFDPIEIADLIERLYSHSSKSLEMGELARTRNFDKFGVERLVQDHQKLYLGIMR